MSKARKYIIDGKQTTVEEQASILDVNPEAIYTRLRKGQPIKKAVEEVKAYKNKFPKLRVGDRRGTLTI